MKARFTIFLLLVIKASTPGLYAQKANGFIQGPDTLVAVKYPCETNGTNNRIRILEHKWEDSAFRKGQELFPAPAAYTYTELYLAEPALKINLLEQLLSFEHDREIVCSPVAAYKVNMVDSFIKLSSTSYTMQIEALYHFNFICFGNYAPGYAPFPVLYDKAEQREINNDQQKIREVTEIYRKWFTETRNKNFENYYFPLLETNFEWRFGSSEKVLMKEFPEIIGEILHWLGRPKN